MFNPATRELHITGQDRVELHQRIAAAFVGDGFDRLLAFLSELGHPLDGPVDVFCGEAQ